MNPIEKPKKKGKYTKEMVEQICELIRAGNSVVNTCKLVKLCPDTYYEWLKNKPEFKESIEEAEAQAIADAVATLKRAALEDWKAALAYLERKDRNWSNLSRVDHTTNGKDITFTIDFGKVLKEEDSLEEEE